MRKKDKARHKSGSEELLDRREQIRQLKVPRPIRDKECTLKTENMEPTQIQQMVKCFGEQNDLKAALATSNRNALVDSV